MGYWQKVGAGRYKHPEHEVFVAFDQKSGKWILQFKGHIDNGKKFIIKRAAQDAAFPRQSNPDSYKRTLQDYYKAPSGHGSCAYEWDDKPHRLIYDLVSEVVACHDILMRHGLLEEKNKSQRMPLAHIKLDRYLMD